MRYRKTISVVAGAAFAAYQAGEHLRYIEPTPGQIMSLATATSTASTTGAMVIVNYTTFATIEPVPPIVPANQKFEQT